MLTIDPVTLGEYFASADATARAQAIAAALADPVSVRVYDGAGQVMGHGTLMTPWAQQDGDALYVMPLASFVVTEDGEPNPETWYLRFESGSRWLRGSFGFRAQAEQLAPDFTWSLASWSAGQSGRIGQLRANAIEGQTTLFGWTIPDNEFDLGDQAQGATFDFSTLTETGGDPAEFALVLGPSGVAVNAAGVGTFGAAVGVYTGLQVSLSRPIAQVTGLDAQAAVTTANLTWTPLADVTGYLVEQLVGATWTEIAATTAPNHAVSDLSPSTAYSWRVRGTNGVTTGPYSATASATTGAQPSAGQFEPPITGEAQPTEQYRTVDNTNSANVGGVSYRHYYQRLDLRWENANVGDYTGTTAGVDVAQGGSAFSSGSVAAGVGYKTFDATTLAQRALTANKGFYLRMSGSNGPSVTWGGRLSANPPLLSVTTNQGTFDCPCILSTAVYPRGATEYPVVGTSQFDTSSSRYGILQFDLSSVQGTIISATLSLYANALFGSGRVLSLFELRPPVIQLGVGSITATASSVDGVTGVPANTIALGIAAELGEDNLAAADGTPGHADIYCAGHFEGTTFSGGTAYPPRIRNFGRIEYTNAVEIVPDPDAPGTSYWRGTAVNVTGGSTGRELFKKYYPFTPAVDNGTTYPIDTSQKVEEVYTRHYFMLESDWTDTSEGIKMGIGITLQFGIWVPNQARPPFSGYWEPEGGNSSSYGDGMAHLGDCHDGGGSGFEPEGAPTNSNFYFHHGDNNVDTGSGPYGTRYVYKGCMQFNLGGLSGRQTAYHGVQDPHWDIRRLQGYNYNIDARDVFGDGQSTLSNRTTNPVRIKLGRWYCFEQYLKMNTVDMSRPILGRKDGSFHNNYEANPDGIHRTWLNGLLVDEKTNFRWRRCPDMGIQGAGLLWYTGGNGTTNWPFPAHFRVSHVVVSKRYIGPRVYVSPAPATVLSQQAALLTSPGWLMDGGSVKDVGPLLNASDAQGDGFTVLQRASGTVINDWCGHLCYDPVGKQIVAYMGGTGSSTSTASSYRVRFDEAANTWTKLQNPFPGTVGTYDGMPTGHGYYSNAIDTAGRRMWRMNLFTDSAFTSVALKEVNLDTLEVQAERPRTGGTLPQGLAYLPGRNWLISTHNGQIRRLDVSTTGTSWVDIAPVSANHVAAGHTVGAQHPVTGRVLIGGGSNGSGVRVTPGGFYEVDTDGTIRGPWEFPSGVYADLGGSFQSLVVADPAGDGWVIFNYDRTVWRLSGPIDARVFTNTGFTVPTTGAFTITSGSAMNNRNAVPLSGMGCILVLFNDFSDNAVRAALFRAS